MRVEKMELDRDYFFRKENLNKVMLKMCVPTVITILVMIIYNMADLFFIGMTGNPILVTAVSLSMPVFTILQALGTLLGAGGCSAAAIAYGNKDEEKVKRISSFCFFSAIVLGVLFGSVLLLNKAFILQLLGCSEEVAPYVESYISVLGIGAPVILFSNVFANIIRANGSATKSMLGNGIGTITNIILDPILIVVFNMGIVGAAVATVIGNVLAAIFLAYQANKKDSGLSLKPKYFTLKKEISIHVLSLGWASTISIVLQSISAILFNRVLARHGDLAIAAMGIASRAGMLIAMLQMGITLGMQPIIAYNFGAGDFGRLKAVLKRTAMVVIIVGSFITLICFSFRAAIVSSFIDNAEIISLGSFMVIAVIISGPISGIYQLSTSFLQATNKAWAAIITAALRQGVIFLPALYILSTAIGLNGVVFTQPIADYVSTTIAVGIAYMQYKKLSQTLIVAEDKKVSSL
jgi:putative MATE family efflux protein